MTINKKRHKDLSKLNVNHDCWKYPKYYEFLEDGHRYHGYECEICGELLQTG